MPRSLPTEVGGKTMGALARRGAGNMKPFEQDERFADQYRDRPGSAPMGRLRGGGESKAVSSFRSGEERPVAPARRIVRDDEGTVTSGGKVRPTRPGPAPEPVAGRPSPDDDGDRDRDRGDRGDRGRSDRRPERPRGERKPGTGRPARPVTQPRNPEVPAPLASRALLDEGDALIVDAGEVRRAADRAVSRGRARWPAPAATGLRDVGDAYEVHDDDDFGVDEGFGDHGDFVDFDDEDPGSSAAPDRDDDVRSELTRAVGSTRAPRLEARLADASRAFRREQFLDAAKILRKLATEAPGATAVRELYGLTLYRQEKWRKAILELEAFRLTTGSVEQHPVLADCYRALEQWSEVDALWEELKEASPSAELVVEGRIVASAAKADRGDLKGALVLLQQGWKMPKRAQLHHLRRAYALADLLERAGELAKARELFTWVAQQDAEFADAKRRARALK